MKVRVVAFLLSAIQIMLAFTVELFHRQHRPPSLRNPTLQIGETLTMSVRVVVHLAQQQVVRRM